MQLSSLDANCVYAVVAVFYLKTSRIQRTITRTRTRTFKNIQLKHLTKSHRLVSAIYDQFLRVCARHKKMIQNETQLESNSWLLPSKRNVPTRPVYEVHEPIESGSKVWAKMCQYKDKSQNEGNFNPKINRMKKNLVKRSHGCTIDPRVMQTSQFSFRLATSKN